MRSKLAHVESTIVSDGGENDLRHRPVTHLPLHRDFTIYPLKSYQTTWEVSSQPLHYDQSPSLSCITDDNDELDGEVEAFGETRAFFALVRVSCSAFISGGQGVGHIQPP